MQFTGAQIMMKVLKEEKVETIFGYPGGAVLDVYNELLNTDFAHILVRQEQGAVHAADAYARVSGKTGVCLVTSGPGATNTITGIASAYCDSIPVVIFTGQVPTPLIGNDAFQEVDIVGISRPCTKHNYLVKDVKDLAGVIREAFYIARSGRPGPVLIDMPKDVINAKTTYEPPKPMALKSYNPTYEPNVKQLKKVIDLVKTAKKPVIFSGGGIIFSGAAKELTRFAKKARIPVTSTLMGLGAFPATDDLWLGMPGMHGTYRANLSLSSCDLLIAVGVRFDDRVTGKTSEFAANATIVHIDIDPTSIQKNVRVAIPIVGDCKAAMARLNKMADEDKDLLSDKVKKERTAWAKQIADWKKTKPLAYTQTDVIKPQYVVEQLYELTKGQAIITTEVGQNQMWAAQYYHYTWPGQFITSGGLGVMGFGLPAAVGAQVAAPDKVVIDIAGDGSIQMNIQEMMTAVSHNLPVKIAILNNGFLGMVRQWQELFYDRRYAWTDMAAAPDFVKLAEAYGAVGLRATKPSEVAKVIKKALATPKPVIMDFVVEKEENVYPMVPAGSPITNMILV
ncbi:biosynthetic-type acetolactate synthase large subunit [Desulfosudis oleivorans]|uniref:Acetolactate synthase n=1 Tax=Desulfosudis oleivorans (strain DSM 6200 / JCM 39069 / Hxd3) TaxID=96561 RepID=A8ZTQ8_DESOH|nr:biosynthetic-type acetolactate synthase large subunit [Desulfosudis oleivorans]ABW67841.1 acetolactate synthase, large subunit, biosynthetic type [Desulfosudis oleivorans Hxd3]